jgi:hypothetical protein
VEGTAGTRGRFGTLRDASERRGAGDGKTERARGNSSSPGSADGALGTKSFRAILERSDSKGASGSPTRGGLTRAFASSGLT